MQLEIKNLHKKFGKREVLKGVNFKIDQPMIVGLVGPNGCGKSTLIKCINDLLVIDEGEILFDGQKQSPETKEMISYLPDSSALDAGWQVKDAVGFFTDFYSDFDASRANMLIKDMHIPMDAEIKSMSKGMQEKLQLILAMSRKAKLYILDEPLSGVDPASRDKILDTILTNFEDDASLLISTHLISDIERVLDRVLFMKDGKIIIDEEAEALRAKRNMSVDEIFRKEFE